MRAVVACTIALALVTGKASAEVRIRTSESGPVLAVDPVAQGIWTPRGAADLYTINPQGDALGDGAPSQSTVGGELVAAWQRPLTHSIVVLQATSAESSTSIEVAVGENTGTPIVRRLGSATLVIWQRGVDAEVMAVAVGGGNVGSAVSIVPGRLLDVYEIRNTLSFVAFDAVRRELAIGTMPTGWIPSPIPVPITRVLLLRTAGLAPLELAPPPEFVASPDTWRPCVEEHGDDVLLAWRAGRSVLGRVVLNATGVEGANEFYRSPNGACPALLNAARRH